VATADKMYLVETKAANRVDDASVRQKRMAAINWCNDVNNLPEDDRMNRRWAYVLLSDSDFYSYRNNNATILDMCAFAEVTEHGLKGEFDF